jgi:hypothetical protein
MKWLGKWKLILSPALSSLSKSSTDRIVKLLRNHGVHYGTLAWTEILMAGAKIFNLNDSLREVFNDEVITRIFIEIYIVIIVQLYVSKQLVI